MTSKSKLNYVHGCNAVDALVEWYGGLDNTSGGSSDVYGVWYPSDGPNAYAMQERLSAYYDHERIDDAHRVPWTMQLEEPATEQAPPPPRETGYSQAQGEREFYRAPEPRAPPQPRAPPPESATWPRPDPVDARYPADMTALPRANLVEDWYDPAMPEERPPPQPPLAPVEERPLPPPPDPKSSRKQHGVNAALPRGGGVNSRIISTCDTQPRPPPMSRGPTAEPHPPDYACETRPSHSPAVEYLCSSKIDAVPHTNRLKAGSSAVKAPSKAPNPARPPTTNACAACNEKTKKSPRSPRSSRKDEPSNSRPEATEPTPTTTQTQAQTQTQTQGETQTQTGDSQGASKTPETQGSLNSVGRESPSITVSKTEPGTASDDKTGAASTPEPEKPVEKKPSTTPTPSAKSPSVAGVAGTPQESKEPQEAGDKTEAKDKSDTGAAKDSALAPQKSSEDLNISRLFPSRGVWPGEADNLTPQKGLDTKASDELNQCKAANERIWRSRKRSANPNERKWHTRHPEDHRSIVSVGQPTFTRRNNNMYATYPVVYPGRLSVG